MQHPKDILTEFQYRELQKTVDVIVSNKAPLQIIMFGLVQFHSTRQNSFVPPEQSINSHYFLLIITESDKRPVQELKEYTHPGHHNVKLTIISCGLKRIERSLLNNDRFFNTIFRDGVSLYKGSEVQNNHRWEPDNLKIQFNAERHLTNHWTLGLGFLAAARSAMDEENEQQGIAVYFLHQATIQACLMLIKVASGFKPPTRNLKKLLEQCLCFEPYVSIHFKNDTGEDARLFGVLVNAYDLAVHEDEFEATSQDAELLMEQVDEFMVMVQVCCSRMIKSW